MVDGFAKTPRYVLRDGPQPSCPLVLQAAADIPSAVIFGFSDKPEYDAFLESSSLALTPYPLVKGFLHNQIALEPNVLRLVVLDAASPDQTVFHAATFQAVLESFQSATESIPISHQLVRDQKSSSYRVQSYEDMHRERVSS